MEFDKELYHANLSWLDNDAGDIRHVVSILVILTKSN